ncbi:MAG: amino acid dehydrogenase [Proteobacteria bacterium]|nr:amino acid dehydrogenase [Pseudomonadota bacterium]
MRVLVIGAGVIGVTSAWYLAKAGHEVTVIDRQETPGTGTSFANGGQISVGQAEPWANPAAPYKIVKWLGREDAPLMFRLRCDPKQWSWALKFLRECLPSRTQNNTLTCLRLADYSRNKLKELRAETGITYDDLQKGILTLHSDEREFEMACNRVDIFKKNGVDIQIKSKSQVLEIEPALKKSHVDIVGATFAPDDESGDAHIFTNKMKVLAEKNGVTFGMGVEALNFRTNQSKVNYLEANVAGRCENFSADAYVVALGSHSPDILSKIGVKIPVYPVKGYSVTIPLENTELAPTVCITDENAKIAISRLGSRLRAAGTAELAGYDLSIRDERCEAIISRVKKLFPEVGGFSKARKWSGLRPAVPSNIPIIGKTKYENLYVNTGQGTLGWTLACGSGIGLANVISEKPQDINFPFLN